MAAASCCVSSPGAAAARDLLAVPERPPGVGLELNPSASVSWGGLQFFEHKDVLAMLRPVLLINQQLHESLGFARIDPNVRRAPLPDELVAEVVEPARSAPHHEFVAVASLSEYAGKRLQFITYDGVCYQGVLHKMGNGQAFLSVQFGTGGTEMFLRLEKIDKVRGMF